MHHPGFRFTTPRGDVRDLDAYIAGNTGGALVWRAQYLVAHEVVVAGEAAVLTGVMHDEFERAGEPGAHDMHVTFMWSSAPANGSCSPATPARPPDQLWTRTVVSTSKVRVRGSRAGRSTAAAAPTAPATLRRSRDPARGLAAAPAGPRRQRGGEGRSDPRPARQIGLTSGEWEPRRRSSWVIVVPTVTGRPTRSARSRPR